MTYKTMITKCEDGTTLKTIEFTCKGVITSYTCEVGSTYFCININNGNTKSVVTKYNDFIEEFTY